MSKVWFFGVIHASPIKPPTLIFKSHASPPTSGKSNYQGGSRGRFELTPNCRFHIVGRAAGDQTVRAILQDLKIAPSTMQIIVGRADFTQQQ